jgi:hypothetical protein
MELLGKPREENGDCDVFAGLSGAKTEFLVVDVDYLEEEPPLQALTSVVPRLKPRIVLALELMQ